MKNMKQPPTEPVCLNPLLSVLHIQISLLHANQWGCQSSFSMFYMFYVLRVISSRFILMIYVDYLCGLFTGSTELEAAEKVSTWPLCDIQASRVCSTSLNSTLSFSMLWLVSKIVTHSQSCYSHYCVIFSNSLVIGSLCLPHFYTLWMFSDVSRSASIPRIRRQRPSIKVSVPPKKVLISNEATQARTRNPAGKSVSSLGPKVADIVFTIEASACGVR